MGNINLNQGATERKIRGLQGKEIMKRREGCKCTGRERKGEKVEGVG